MTAPTGFLRRALLGAGLLAAPACAAEDGVATALVVSVDVSGSVDETRFRLQMEGIAGALETPAVLAAITGNPGGIFFAMVTWADEAELSVGWRRIASKADAKAAAALVRGVPRQTGDFTCVGRMMAAVTASVLPALPVQADRVVVDVSGDGADNCTEPDTLRQQRQALLATGATVNGLPILVPGENDVVGAGAFRAPGYGLREMPIQEDARVSLEQWYRANVVGGPGAFILAAQGYGDFARALRQKFVIEIGLRDVPRSTVTATR